MTTSTMHCLADARQVTASAERRKMMSDQEIDDELERIELAIIEKETELWELQQQHKRLTGKTYHK